MRHLVLQPTRTDTNIQYQQQIKRMKFCSVGRPRPKAAGKARSIQSSRSLKLADWARTPNTTEEWGHIMLLLTGLAIL